MQDTVHLYVFDGHADWEAAFAVAGIQDPRCQREPGRWRVRTVGEQQGAIVRSMGGVGVLVDIGFDHLRASSSRLLILPGGAGWEDDRLHRAALGRAAECLSRGVPVAAICGATAGLARAGLLDQREHTSNAAAYLRGTGYAGAARYRDEPAVRDGGLITAGGMAPLEFARAVFEELAVYEPEALEAWFQLHKTGKPEYFARMHRAAEAGVAG